MWRNSSLKRKGTTITSIHRTHNIPNIILNQWFLCYILLPLFSSKEGGEDQYTWGFFFFPHFRSSIWMPHSLFLKNIPNFILSVEEKNKSYTILKNQRRYWAVACFILSVCFPNGFMQCHFMFAYSICRENDLLAVACFI